MKKIYYKIILLICSIYTLFACKEEFIFDQDGIKEYVVIEGGISNKRALYRFNITRSQKVIDNKPVEGINGAFITLSDNMGNIDTLMPFYENDYFKYFDKLYIIDTASNGHIDSVFIEDVYNDHNISGNYITTKKFIPQPGRYYTLNVKVEGKKYFATEFLPLPPVIDSIKLKTIYREIKEGGSIEAFHYPLFYFKDSPLTEDYYLLIYPHRFTFYCPQIMSIIPDTYLNQYNNGLGQGLYNTEEAAKGIREYDPFGSDMTMYLYKIPHNVYDNCKDYILHEMKDGVFSPAPATIKSNFTGGALGCFFVGSFDSRIVKIPGFLKK
jgi:hypothetical protein